MAGFLPAPRQYGQVSSTLPVLAQTFALGSGPMAVDVRDPAGGFRLGLNPLSSTPHLDHAETRG